LAVKLANWPTLRCNSRHTRNGRLDALGATQVVSAQRHATPPATARVSSAGLASSAT